MMRAPRDQALPFLAIAMSTFECLVQVCDTQHPSDDVVVESAANWWRRLWRHRTSYWRGPSSLRRPFLGERQALASMGNCSFLFDFIYQNLSLGVWQVLIVLVDFEAFHAERLHHQKVALTSMPNNCSRCQISGCPFCMRSTWHHSCLICPTISCAIISDNLFWDPSSSSWANRHDSHVRTFLTKWQSENSRQIEWKRGNCCSYSGSAHIPTFNS